MFILFISDVHLSSTKPNIVKGFLNFLYNQATQAQALYILGDLFDIWLGDDHQNLMYFDIAQGFQELKKRKIPCYFIRGNHDFLLGTKYANFCGMILLNDNQIVQLPSGKNIIILHGDILCIYDQSYQKLRPLLHCHILQKIFLLLPISIRSYLFKIARSYCINHKQYKIKNLNINVKQVINILIQNKSEIMIHGHTHLPAIHNISFSKEIVLQRIVLGCWNTYGSALKINKKTGNITLIKFLLDSYNK